MVKEMPIFNELKEIANGSNDLTDKLNGISEWLSRNFHIECAFCELLGRRWSYVAGSNGVIAPQERIVLNENLGMMVDSSAVDIDGWNDVVEAIKEVIV